MNENSEQKLSTIDALHEALENDNRETAKIIIASLHPSEIADILESVPSREREDLWGLIDAEIEGDVLAHMQDAVRSEFLEHMRPDEVIDATKDLEADDVADILQQELGTNLGTEYFPNPYDSYQMHTQADISTSQTNLGFNPVVSLEEGIKDYIPEIRRLHGTDIS